MRTVPSQVNGSMYKRAPGLWVITTYYNPCKYKSRLKNYDIFERSLREAGIPLLTVECSFNDEPELKGRPSVINVNSDNVMWQKERLLNLAASWLPPSAKYVAWIDCDVLFDNESWAVDTVKLLQTHQVAQLFETANRLGEDGEPTDPPDISRSFASVTVPDPKTALSHKRYDAHGHTGYAWAMRRELFDEVGLYEAAVSGSADHFMAHAIYNDYCFCIENALKRDPKQIKHLREWGETFYEKVQGSLACVPGELKHLWHGELEHRRYFLRMHEITDLGFDPYTDLLSEPGRPLAWRTHKPELHQYFVNYFKSRREDGQDQSSAVAR